MPWVKASMSSKPSLYPTTAMRSMSLVSESNEWRVLSYFDDAIGARSDCLAARFVHIQVHNAVLAIVICCQRESTVAKKKSEALIGVLGLNNCVVILGVGDYTMALITDSDLEFVAHDRNGTAIAATRVTNSFATATAVMLWLGRVQG